MEKKDKLEELFFGMKGKATHECNQYALVFDAAANRYVFGLKKKEFEKP
jgi:hypothetical protein